MERLTAKENKKYTLKAKSQCGGPDFFSAIQKLGQLEDIEEELGIDLVTLIKALTDTIAIKNKDGSVTEMWACPRFQISLHKGDSWILYGPVAEQNVLHIKDYGKT